MKKLTLSFVLVFAMFFVVSCGGSDSNNDEIIDMADSVLIMQSLANPSKYGVNGMDEHHITEQGLLRADIDGNGVTNMDALTIQNYLLGNLKIK